MATTTRDRNATRRHADRPTEGSGRAGSRPAGSGRERSNRGTPRRPAGGDRITARNLRAEDRRWLEANASELSPSTLRAKWVHTRDEHEDRPGQTLATREPEVVRAWAEQRDGLPATVGRRDGEAPRTLRFDFEGRGGNGRSSRLQPIDWDAWLETFRRRKLVFLFQEHRRNGEDSNFFRLDSPDREEG
jgi:hypothetical protein